MESSLHDVCDVSSVPFREWMLMATDRIPFIDRTSTLFWRGALTNIERKIAAESQAVKDSGLADIQMIGWGTDSFAKEFISLPQHCKNRCALPTRSFMYWVGHCDLSMRRARIAGWIRDISRPRIYEHVTCAQIGQLKLKSWGKEGVCKDNS